MEATENSKVYRQMTNDNLNQNNKLISKSLRAYSEKHRNIFVISISYLLLYSIFKIYFSILTCSDASFCPTKTRSGSPCIAIPHGPAPKASAHHLGSPSLPPPPPTINQNEEIPPPIAVLRRQNTQTQRQSSTIKNKLPNK